MVTSELFFESCTPTLLPDNSFAVSEMPQWAVCVSTFKRRL